MPDGAFCVCSSQNLRSFFGQPGQRVVTGDFNNLAFNDDRFQPAIVDRVRDELDRVRFDACIDASGFGSIYSGWHLTLDERVAIKCLRLAQLVNVDERVKGAIIGRFREDAPLLLRVSDGNHDIVRWIASGGSSSGRPRANACRTSPSSGSMDGSWMRIWRSGGSAG